MLTRHFIRQRLAAYFAQPHGEVIGHLASSNTDDSLIDINSSPINFKTMLGSWHFQRKLSKLYDKRSNGLPEFQWLTPTELFRPTYSNIIGDFIVTNFRAVGKKKLRIIEVGAGRGTNALIMLNRIEKLYPDVYEALCNYTLVDASPTLHELQRTRINCESKHDLKVRFIKTDIGEDFVDYSAVFGFDEIVSEIHTVVIGLEVLDNLPHDKILRKSGTKMISSKNICEYILQAEVNSKTEGLLEEFKPLNDCKLKVILSDFPDYGPSLTGESRWIPTAACQFIKELYRNCSGAHFLMADFDWLPPPTNFDPLSKPVASPALQASWSPLVTDMKGFDHDCYLSAPELCDILFPTDFKSLAAFIADKIDPGMNVQVFKQREFMNIYGSNEIENTKSWLNPSYSPLINEFTNCSIITVTGSPK